MGVGDYVHSKENRQQQPLAHDSHPSNKSRRALAEQARVEVPQTALVAPVPISANGLAPVARYDSPFRDPAGEHAERPVHRDAFDTDVEAIDESTIAATSVMGVDDIPYRMSPTLRAPNGNGTLQRLNFEQAQQPPQPQPEPHQSPSPSPSRQLRPGRRADSKWYEGLGDRALKSAGFDLDELDDASQLTSTAGDDGQSNDTDDQRFIPRYRAGEEPLSRKLQNFWTASRRSTYHPDTSDHSEPHKGSHIPVASTSKPLPASSRKVTLPRSMTATPRTRFSPPKPSLLDQLDLTPTRRSPGITRTHSHKEKERGRGNDISKSTDTLLRDHEDGLGLFTDHGPDNHHALGHPENSLQSLNVFDMTNFDDLENDSSMNDPFSRRGSVRRVGTDTSLTHANTISNMNSNSIMNLTSKTKKRHLEPDYPPEILCTKTFTELQAEPFDKTPNPSTSKPIPSPTKEKEKEKEKQFQNPPEQAQDEDKISFLLRLSDEQRSEHFSKLSMDEWEGCGDLLIEEFSKMMIKMKDLRHARRRMAAVFEAEVKRRNDVVEEQSAEITGKFDEMRAGGAEVLRGRSP